MLASTAFFSASSTPHLLVCPDLSQLASRHRPWVQLLDPPHAFIDRVHSFSLLPAHAVRYPSSPPSRHPPLPYLSGILKTTTTIRSLDCSPKDYSKPPGSIPRIRHHSSCSCPEVVTQNRPTCFFPKVVSTGRPRSPCSPLRGPSGTSSRANESSFSLRLSQPSFCYGAACPILRPRCRGTYPFPCSGSPASMARAIANPSTASTAGAHPGRPWI